jgi:hypothetical protein
MQTERVTFLTSAEAKAALTAKAARRGMSTGEYIRLAVDNMPEESAEETELAALVAELAAAVPAMQASLERTAKTMQDASDYVNQVLSQLSTRP